MRCLAIIDPALSSTSCDHMMTCMCAFHEEVSMRWAFPGCHNVDMSRCIFCYYHLIADAFPIQESVFCAAAASAMMTLGSFLLLLCMSSGHNYGFRQNLSNDDEFSMEFSM